MKNLAAACFLVFGFLAVSGPAARAQDKSKFRWAGDKAGGAPFIFNEGNETIGFEWEFAAYLAEKLGRKPEFIQADWDTLVDLVNRGVDTDIAMNGIEWSSDRGKQATIPYHIYSQRLIVPRDSTIRGWEDLKPGPDGSKPRIEVLLGTFSERFMQEKFGDLVRVGSSKEVDESLKRVQDGASAATVQDSPAAIHYVEGGKYPGLKIVGEPREENYYVILTQEKDKELRERLNEAIREAIRSGKLEQLARKYKLWSPSQERLGYTASRPWPPVALEGEEVAEKPRRTLWDLRNGLLWATYYTVALALCAMPLAILVGILIAVGRVYGPWFLRAPLTLYVEIIRGTPMLLQMYVLFFVAPEIMKLIGFDWLATLAMQKPFIIGVAGLALNYSAYEAEIYRAGLQAIPHGQMEAALSLGMTHGTAIRRVVLPQAVRIVIPPVTNDFINMFKDTSICSMILITELTGFYYQNKYDRDIVYQLAIVIALLYLLMSYPLSLIARRLETKVRRAVA